MAYQDGITGGSTRTVNVNSTSTLKAALTNAQNGDKIVLANGNYDALSTASLTAKQNITVAAANVGMATITGNSTFEIKSNCQNVIFDGLKMTIATQSTLVKIVDSSRIRLDRCTFDGGAKTTGTSVYILLDGTTERARITRCLFSNKKDEGGNYIQVDGTNSTIADPPGTGQVCKDTYIDWNYFRDVGPRIDNGKESIRFGWSQISRSSAQGNFNLGIVEFNLFERCDGDQEIISVKADDVTCRYNTFRDNYGTAVVQRHGRNGRIYGNHIFGGTDTARGGGGVRMYDRGHRVWNNYLQDLKGDSWTSAISVDGGDVSTDSSTVAPSSLSAHFQVQAAEVVHNTLVGCATGIVEGEHYTVAPSGCSIRDNLVTGSVGALFERVKGDSTYAGNIGWPTGSATLKTSNITTGITQANPSMAAGVGGLQRPAAAVTGAASSAYAYVTDDIDGDVRPASARDVGADELPTAATPARLPLATSNVGPASDYSAGTGGGGGGGPVDPPPPSSGTTWYVGPGGGGGGGGDPTINTPADLLRLGSGDGQNHFNLGVGFTTGHVDITPSQLASGYTTTANGAVFTLNAAKTGVRMRVPLAGGTTSANTKYPRVEFREYNEDASAKMAFNPSTGLHYIKGHTKLIHLAPDKPWVTVAQMHNANDDQIELLTRVEGGSLRLMIYLNQVTITNPYMLSSVAAGDEFDWEIRLNAGQLSILINGVDKLAGFASLKDTFSTYTTADQYFKAGCYSQSNYKSDGTGTDNDPNEYMEVELSKLQHFHSGWPTPLDPPSGGTGTGGTTTGGTGTSGDPFTTVQQGIDAAQPGDTVQVAAGTYNEQLVTKRSGTASNRITFRSATLHGANIRGPGLTSGRTIDVTHHFLVFDGLRIANADKAMYIQDGDDGEIRNCWFENSGGEQLRIRGSRWHVHHNLLERSGRKYFSDTGYTDTSSDNGEAIYVGRSPLQTVPVGSAEPRNDNWIHHNKFRFVGSEAVNVKEGSTGNIVEDNDCDGGWQDTVGSVNFQGEGNTARYNLIQHHAGAGIRFGVSSATNDSVPRGVNNNAYGNIIQNNAGNGVKIVTLPQGDICGNTFTGNGAANYSQGTWPASCPFTLRAPTYQTAGPQTVTAGPVGLAGAITAAASVSGSLFVPGQGGGGPNAATIFVDAAAPAGGTGSSAAPFRTLQLALSAAGPGAIIELADGTYQALADTAAAGTTAQRITIRSRNLHGAHIRSAGIGNDRLLELLHDFYILDGLRFSDADILIYGTGADDIEIRNCWFEISGGEMVRIKQGNRWNIHHNLFERSGRNAFNDTGQFDTTSDNGEQIYIGTSPNQTSPVGSAEPCSNIWIHHNIHRLAGSEAVNVKEASTDVNVEDNDIDGGWADTAGAVNVQGETNTVRFNRIRNHAGAGVRLGVSTATTETPTPIPRGVDNDVYGNIIDNVQNWGVKVMSLPQNVMCGNAITNATLGEYSQGDWDTSCAFALRAPQWSSAGPQLAGAGGAASLAGVIEARAGVSGRILATRKLAGLITGQAVVSGELRAEARGSLFGRVTGLSALTGTLTGINVPTPPSAFTQRWYESLPELYRVADFDQAMTLLRYLRLIGDQADRVEQLIDRIDYVPVPDGGSVSDTSDLADPAAAETGWLGWLGQLVGVQLSGSLTETEARDAVRFASAGWRAGTKTALIDAARSALTGDRHVDLYDHSATSPGDGGQWDVLLVTRGSETPSTQAVLDAITAKQAKPAGVIVHVRSYSISWTAQTAAFTTWSSRAGKSWQQIGESGL